ncbi:hypothetical protein [Paraburkholderia flagellata]|uniref:hypothetical protein n=1 Tax=Paraburkholderia flagellata TaxID=2883241 RepID=UPI001F2B4034|nr:hypothetical protein [Paraburkholderia flagellata]
MLPLSVYDHDVDEDCDKAHSAHSQQQEGRTTTDQADHQVDTDKRNQKVQHLLTYLSTALQFELSSRQAFIEPFDLVNRWKFGPVMTTFQRHQPWVANVRFPTDLGCRFIRSTQQFFRFVQ